MSDLVESWVRKAEGDVLTARRERSVTKDSNPDAACFHAQQAVEKYLKALLAKGAKAVPKTHDLRHLLDQAVESPTIADREELSWLSFAAVEARYPGMVTDDSDAARAVEVMERWRTRCRASLGLGSP